MSTYIQHDLTVRQATLKDFDTVRNLLYQTAIWLASKGLSQWGDMTTGARDPKIKSTIESGETFLFYKNSALAGTITLQSTPGDWDLDLWKECDVNYSKTMFVHRIATHRDFSGQGIGKRLLEWSEEFARNEGKTWLRLDCVGDNTTLNAFYKNCGFSYLGVSNNGFSLYEKKI